MRGADGFRCRGLQWGTAVALLVAAGAIRWELLGVRSLWYDEGYSLFVASLGLGNIPTFLRFNDAHPPGYYLLLSWWMREFGRDLSVLRLPSFTAGVLTVLLTWQLARRWVGPWAAVVAGALVAVNAFQVYASNELRMYAPLSALVVGAALALDRALASRGRLWWVAYGCLAAAAAYLSYFAVLAVFLQACWVLWKYRDAWRRLCLALAVGMLAYLPWIPSLPGLVDRNPQLQVVRPPVRGWELVPYTLAHLASQAYGGYLRNTVTYHRTSRLVWPYLAPLVPFAVAAAFSVGTLGRGPAGLAPFVWLGGVALAAAGSAVVGREIAYSRNLVFLQPFAAISVAAGLAEVVQRARAPWGGAGAACLAAGCMALSVVGLNNLQSGDPEFDRYRFDQAGAHVDAHAGPADLVVYFPTGVELAAGYYVRRPLRSVSLPLPVTEWDEQGARSVARRLRPFLAAAGGRVWIVTSLPHPWDRLVRPLLDELERAGFERRWARDFLGVQVLEYKRRSGDGR